MVWEKIIRYLLKGCAGLVTYNVVCSLLEHFSLSDPFGYYSYGIALVISICDYLISLLGGLLVGAGVYWVLWESIGKWVLSSVKKLGKRKKDNLSLYLDKRADFME